MAAKMKAKAAGEPKAVPDAFAREVLDNLRYVQGRIPEIATRHDWYKAFAHAVRDRLVDRWMDTIRTIMEEQAKAVCYLSAEFLMGPHLGNGLLNLGILDAAREAAGELGLELDQLLEEEEEPGLGNGGLGRLAACFMDSLATLGVPAIGFGIRYEFGIFDQAIRDGAQVEITDKWLSRGNPWEIERPEICFDVKLGGRTEAYTDAEGRHRVRWIPQRVVKGVAYDTPVPGFESKTVNLLRLWKAEACESFDFAAFNTGDYLGAVQEKIASETISKVLYPNDEMSAGKHLRLAQQYFFVSCSLQDVIRVHLARRRSLDDLPDAWAVQLNDTHPSIAVAELMRLLVDEHQLDWDRAWAITRKTLSYTNHTLLPEALERWSVPLFGGQLPRHLEIIYEINRRFLDDVRQAHPGDDARVARLSLIDETGQKAVRMAHLACVGSHAINGVAALHTELLKKTVLRDFHDIWPERFRNVTNGVTPRRWVALSNPRLANLITGGLGGRWLRHTEEELPRLEPFADDAAFRRSWREVKLANKRDLAGFLRDRTGVAVDPASIFDVQVKRIHEYKRQHLNVLHAITLWSRLRRGADAPPRAVMLGGKAAPGYFLAKLIIRLVHGVADVVNAEEDGRLRVLFIPDFNVRVGQRVYPAADLSEQISTAGKEASGTGNMKFALNGAVTIGTLDGANVEIREAVGEENFFLFGLTADEVVARKRAGYDPRSVYESDPELRETIDLIADGAFSHGDRELFRPLLDSLLGRDEYLVLTDYRAYIDAQERAGKAYTDESLWTRMSILNTARSGRFSSDRSIREYCEGIWQARPLGE